jgi:type 2 lantibiotic biosynthesis protein LanM
MHPTLDRPVPPRTDALQTAGPTPSMAWLRQIAADAAFLWERADGKRYSPDTTRSDAGLAQARAERWCRAVARGERAGLDQRLRWAGTDLERMRPLLGAVRLGDGLPLPAWTTTLQQIIAAAVALSRQPGALQDSGPPGLYDPQQPIPYEHLLAPAVQVACRRLQFRCGRRSGDGASAELTAPAWRALERALLARLAQLATDTLHAEFRRSRNAGGATAHATTGSARYDAFVREQWAAGLKPLFEQYPVLARLLSTAVAQWVASSAEFVARLRADLPEIECQFAAPPGLRVQSIQAGLSDAHHQGRTVLSLTFTNGLQLVYKPKAIAIEAAYNDLLRHCATWPTGPGLRALAVLNRGDYGWVEFAAHEPCADRAAAARYHLRAGMLLALVYALRGTDCHSENLIAGGEHPLLVDAETLFHHEAQAMAGANDAASDTASQRFWNSVLRTGLLPRWNFSADQRSFSDVSGLAGGTAETRRARVVQWTAINTDAMQVGLVTQALPPDQNAVRIAGELQSPGDYQAEIAHGFARMFRALAQQRETLFAADGPLQAFGRCAVRFIFRPTRIYATVLQRALQPAGLRSGADFSIELEQLSRAFLAGTERPHAWPLLQAELRALERLDIPFFSAPTAAADLVVDGQPVAGCLRSASFNDVATQLARLDEASLGCQLALIDGSFYASQARTVVPQGTPEVFEPLPPPARDALVARAVALAEEIARRAIVDSDGGLNWIGLHHVLEAGRVQLQVVGDSLYDGRSGIAVFLAALHRVTGQARFRTLALQALQPLRRQLQVHLWSSDASGLQRYARFSGLGGAAGLGSVVYALVQVHASVDEAGLLDDAQALAACVTPELVAADTALDVIGGAAGAILGLLTLQAVRPTPQLLARALDCGEHLLRQRRAAPEGPRAWYTLGAARPLTGYSHGAAGIAHALLRLAAASGQARFRDAALEAIDYERSVFDPIQGGWPDFRTPQAAPPCLAQWCHGAAGIGLGRLGGLAVADGPQIAADIEHALVATRAHDFDAIDHLCCGNAGRIETLLVAAQHLSRPALRQDALQRMANVLARADRDGGFKLSPNLPSAVFDPGLFRGTSGVGYQLLRLAREDLPSVLLWA